MERAAALRGPARAVLLLLGLAAAACGGGGGPEARWIPLARGFTPRTEIAESRPWVRTLDGSRELTLSPAEEGDGVWVECVLRAEDWERLERHDAWWTRRPVRGFGIPAAEGGPCRLTVEGEPYRYVHAETDASLDRDAEGRLPEGLDERCFTIRRDSVFLVGAGAEPPEEARLALYCTRGEAEGDAWRVKLETITADGLPVWPGQREEVRCELPPASVLRSATAAQGSPVRAGRIAGDLTFRVRLDDAVLFEHDQEIGRRPSIATHEVPLPRGGARRVTLSFEVDGGGVLTAFLNPVVGPADPGTYRERPWPTARPDVVLFVADTFRADNMDSFGGERGLTPVLDGLAARSRTFQRAWSPSTWTLPAHGSLFTGLFPEQHTATTFDNSLPDELVTVAEHLRAAGYRTVAKTDHGWVTEARGLDQGFELFVEDTKNLGELLEYTERLLDADDGRPLFLFLHTYHTHSPFWVSEETRREFGDRFDFADMEELHSGPFENVEEWLFSGELSPDRRRELQLFHDLYLGTVIDLDRAFGRVLAALERRGVLDNGYLIFTSDHGEAFYEHQTIAHGSGMWEESLRIPLLIHGAGVAPGRVEHAATLVDVPLTIASMAGLAPHPDWLGSPLLALDRDRPIFSHECDNRGHSSSVAIRSGDRKLVVPARAEDVLAGTIELAYDLAADPLEQDDVAGRAEWAEELLRALGTPAVRLLEPAVGVSRSRLSPEAQEQLRALGY